MTVSPASVISAAGRHRRDDDTTTRGQGPTNNAPAPREFAQSAPPASGGPQGEVLDTGTPITPRSAALDEVAGKHEAASSLSDSGLISRATEPTARTVIVKSASIPGAFSKATSRPTCQSCSRPSSNSSSTSERRGRSALRFRNRCWPPQTR